MYFLWTAEQKWINDFNLKVKVKKIIFQNCRKTWIFSIIEQILVSIAGDDKKINNMVIEVYVSTINS